MKNKLLALVAAIGCFTALAATVKADVIIIHGDGSHETIPSEINAIVTIDTKGNITTTYPPPPKPANTAN